MGKQPLGIELVKKGIVTAEDIEKALKYQENHRDRKLGDILYILKVIESKKLIKGVAEILGEKGVILKYEDIPEQILNYIPFDVMKKNFAVPFETENGKIKVAFADVKNNQENMKSIRMFMLNKGLVLDPYIAFSLPIICGCLSFCNVAIVNNIPSILNLNFMLSACGST